MKLIELTELELNNLPLDEQAVYLFNYAESKNTDGRWKKSNCPVAKDSKPRFKGRWKEAVKKKHDITGEQVTAWYILQYWKADTIARKKARDNRQFVSDPVGAAYWIHEERWNNGTIIKEEQKTVREANKCHCGKDVHGWNTECLYHINFTKDGKMKGVDGDLLRSYAKENGVMNMTREECVTFIRKNEKKIGHKNILLDKK